MRHPPRRELLTAVGTVAVVGGLAGCARQVDGGVTDSETSADGAEEGREMGALRVVHASPDAPTVDIYIDERLAIEALAFGEIRPSQELHPGRHRLQLTAAGDQSTVVFDRQIEIPAGTSRTAVAYGEASGGPATAFSVEVLEDELADPGAGMSRLRLFHAAPDAGELAVVVTEAPDGYTAEQPQPNQSEQQGNRSAQQGNQSRQQPAQSEPQQPSPQLQQGAVLFERLAFGESASRELPAGDYSLGVVPAGNDQQSDDQAQPGNESTQPQQDREQPETESTQPPNETNRSQQDPPQFQEGRPTQPPIAAFDLTAESRTVYSAFAMGYVSPEAAPVDEAFEILTVVDARNGERASGGTGGTDSDQQQTSGPGRNDI